MDQVKLRWLVGGVFLLAISLFNFVTYTNTASQQSTFNILPGDYYYLAATRSSNDAMSGMFQETSGNPVSFYIMSSAQYASFQIGSSVSSVYSIVNLPTGSISYTFTTQDTYYLVFRHGQGLLNSTETVSFQRTYTTHDSLRLSLGILFLIFAVVEVAVAFRPRRTNMTPTPPPAAFGSVPASMPSPASPQPVSRVCKTCGQVTRGTENFCPSCGSQLEVQQ